MIILHVMVGSHTGIIGITHHPQSPVCKFVSFLAYPEPITEFWLKFKGWSTHGPLQMLLHFVQIHPDMYPGQQMWLGSDRTTQKLFSVCNFSTLAFTHCVPCVWCAVHMLSCSPVVLRPLFSFLYHTALRWWQVCLGLIQRWANDILYIKLSVPLYRIWTQQRRNQKITYGSMNLKI